jgi:hypothetical protein
MENRVSDLADDALGIASVSISFLLVNVDIIVLDLDPDSSTHVLVNVDWARHLLFN